MNTENLHNQEAIAKLQDLVNKIDIGMMCTYPQNNDYIHAVPMSRQEVDDDGNIWYLFSSESDTHTNLMANKHASILFSHVGDYNFLSINGVAEISRNEERIEKYWNKMIETWFEKGKSDPRIRVLKINVEDAHYWDNKTNKLVTLLKLATNAITGNKLDVGRDGNLDI